MRSSAAGRIAALLLVPSILLTASMLLAALARPAAADDADTIAACLKTEQEAQGDGRTCIGRISGPCLDKPGNESTASMVECIDGETKIWDHMLNEDYQKLLGVLEGKAAEQVRSAQRLWVQLRDADCHVPYDIFDGGTMAIPMAAQCVLDRTAWRTLQMREWWGMAHPEE